MTAAAPLHRASPASVLRYFAVSRGLEVALLQASPMLGAWLAGVALDADSLPRLLWMLAGSIALTAHAFVINDWAGYGSDATDARRTVAADAQIARRQIATLSAALLLFALAALAVVGAAPLAFGIGIAATSTIYSCAPSFGKGTPCAASLNHLVGGALHFLLGFAVVVTVDSRAVVLSLFFGLVFAAGHLNQEVRDHRLDAAVGVRTAAVAFGPRAAFLGSFALFTLAYGLLIALAVAGRLPALVAVAAAMLWALQARWAAGALRRGLEAGTALWMRRRYRILFAACGVVLVVAETV